MSAATDALQEQLIDIIEEQVKPLFNADFRDQMRVSVLIRFEDAPGCDVIVTSDDEAGIRAIVDRRYGGTDAS